MASSTTTLQLHHRESFEQNVTRALFAGATAGTLHFAALRFDRMLGLTKSGLPFPAPDAFQLAPLTYLVFAATAVALAKGDRLDRWMLRALGVVLPALPWFAGLSAAWTVGLSAAAVGGLMVRSHLCERGEEGQVGGARPGFFNYALGAALTGALAVVGAEVARAIAVRLQDAATPMLISVLISATTIALFVGIGSIAAHLALKPDPVEARCEELLPKLSGELKILGQRALTLYQQCGGSLAQLPREPAREEMARTLSRMTQEAVELAAEWSGLEDQLAAGADVDLGKQLEELDHSARTARDPIARRQLEMAAGSLREERDRLDQLSLQRERIVAKLKAEVALLERARVALIGTRGGQMQVRAAELSALARKFSSLSDLQTAEGKMADAVAMHTELAHHEAAEPAPDLSAPVRLRS